mmetsp:Transcript_66243/g.176442  ORF Transcript_66243/g.176442 Transcript_66243/m.176442 type:complete len:236 (-) Transcript_66243:7-714(-)
MALDHGKGAEVGVGHELVRDVAVAAVHVAPLPIVAVPRRSVPFALRGAQRGILAPRAPVSGVENLLADNGVVDEPLAEELDADARAARQAVVRVGGPISEGVVEEGEVGIGRVRRVGEPEPLFVGGEDSRRSAVSRRGLETSRSAVSRRGPETEAGLQQLHVGDGLIDGLAVPRGFDLATGHLPYVSEQRERKCRRGPAAEHGGALVGMEGRSVPRGSAAPAAPGVDARFLSPTA